MTGSDAKMRRAGILGGMGPEATLVFLEKFYSLTRGRREQARPALLVNIDPTVPDRNEAWRGIGSSPAAALTQMGLRLKKAGADFCVMACITAHGFVESFDEEVGIPLIRLPDVVAEALGAGAAAGGVVGLLATTTTLEMSLFQKAFTARNSSLIVPDAKEQEALMRAIYSIKKGENARSDVLDVAKSLVARGAQTVLLGCTDLSVLGPLHLWGCTVVDALDLLAARTLVEIEK
ncbi:MAG TPA: amino acid racemase [Steroidobacteraceae bacterium]|nr:amino acid racemase [Steroidobacteraceae bacterium]